MKTVSKRFKLCVYVMIKAKVSFIALLAFFVFLNASCVERADRYPALKIQEMQLHFDQPAPEQVQSTRTQLSHNWQITTIFLLALLLGVSYSHHRLRLKANQMLQSKQDEINEKNQILDQLLDEKDWMLKEIHHRVRNNLQIVTSLLNAKASQISDNSALSTIRESQHQVQAIAFIHQRLYQSEQVARVDLEPYLTDLVVYLREAYNMMQSIRFNLSVEPISLDVALAVPLGLIVNEAVTNALKYAFPAGRSGTIRLRLSRAGNTTFKVTIEDDGIGLPEGYDFSQSHSPGMTLMQGLSKQMEAVLEITGSHGVTVDLFFNNEQRGSDNKADPNNSKLQYSNLSPILRLEGLAFERYLNTLK